MTLTTPESISAANRTPERPSRAAVSVEELQRAWASVQAGDFRRRSAPIPCPVQATSTSGRADSTGDDGAPANHGIRAWVPAVGEQVLPVLGCAGSAGTTTVALALALAADIPARVVECCSVTASGLSAASHAELGLHDTGWRQGRRDRALLERVNGMVERPTDIPAPSPGPPADGARSLSVLDVGWDLRQLLADPCWLRETILTSPTVIVVTPATVPGLRRLETALELLGNDRMIAALLGPRLPKWPKVVAHSTGHRTRQLLNQGCFQVIPQDRGLAVAGLDSTPLPPRLLHAAAELLAQADTDPTLATDPAVSDSSGRRSRP